MCRLALYWGPPILISEFLLKPSRSIIKQSYEARERRNDSSLPFHLGYGNLNGDGFGIGWYSIPSTCTPEHRDSTPCTFTSVTPAWNNDNLNRLASKLESGLIFAHVRAAYPGMPVSEQNCHPFAHGNYLFMHNGVIAGFLSIRRRLLDELSDEAYNSVQSFHSDSAVSFALFLHHLPNMKEKQSAETLLRAVQATIATIARIQKEAGITDTSLLNYVVSDGNTTVATRYVSNDEQPASLYFAEGAAYERAEENDNVGAARTVQGAGDEAGAVATRSAAVTGESDYHLAYGGTGARVCLIASEPVTGVASDWTEVPRNTALVVCREKGGLLTVVQAPLTASGEHPRAAEVQRCLEAVTGAAGIALAGTKSASHGNLRLAAVSVPVPHRHGHAADDAPPDTPRVDLHQQASLSRGTLGLSREISTQSLDEHMSESPADHRLTGHRGAVMALVTYEDLLFSGSTDTTVKVWSLKDCKYLRTLTGHRAPIRQLAVSKGVLYSAGAKTVRLWSLVDFSCTAVLCASDVRGSIKALAAAPNGTIYVGGQDCQVKAYLSVDGLVADSPRCMQLPSDTIRSCTGIAQEPKAISDPAHAHCASVTCIALLGNDYVCSGSNDGTIRVWQASTLSFVKTLRGHRGSVLALHAVPGLLLSGGRDNLIRAWDAETLVCRRTLSGHTDDITQIASGTVETSASGIVLNGGAVHDPRTIVTRDGPPPLRSHHSSDALGGLFDSGSIRIHPLGPAAGVVRLFASASADGTVRIWNPSTLTCLQIINIHRTTTMNTSAFASSQQQHAGVMACALSSSYAVAGRADGDITLFPAEDMYQKAAGKDGNEATSPVAKKRRLDDAREDTDMAMATTNQSEITYKLEREFQSALRLFIRIKTVSADPSKSEECFRGAKFLLRLLESMGAEVKLAQPVEGKNPVVLARIGNSNGNSDANLPCVTCYGHYDVQPAMEPDWQTDPFEVNAVDGYLIARGVSDNKGPVLAFVYAVKELLERDEKLPVNVAFIFEGEEENGSIGFRDAVMQNAHWFAGTQAILISNTLWVGEKRPCLTYAMRGMISCSLEVRGPCKDLHSGNEGGVFSEPLADLSHILASLVDSRSNINVPGFYDDVRPDMHGPALQRFQSLEASSEFSLEGYKAALGVKELTAGRSVRDLLTARWCQPSLSVVDVRVGTSEEADTAHYRFGPTRFSVIPRAAVGKVSIRFVPDQDAESLIEKLRAHVDHEFAKLRSGNSINLKVHSMGDWWQAPPESPLFKVAEDAVTAEWGEVPLLVREGGTMPVASALEKMIGAPALLLPMGQSSDACHLANERIRWLNLVRGKNVIKNILVGLGGKDTRNGN